MQENNNLTVTNAFYKGFTLVRCWVCKLHFKLYFRSLHTKCFISCIFDQSLN